MSVSTGSQREKYGKRSLWDRHKAGSILRVWLRLWMPLVALALVSLVGAPPAGATTGGVSVSAEVRQSFSLSLDTDGISIASNGPWSVEILQGSVSWAYFGGPTEGGRIETGGPVRFVTVVADPWGA